MQIYLFFERELSKYIINKYNLNDNYISLFYGINIIEGTEKIETNSSIKRELDLYRNIINIYKHGYGDSYKRVKESNPDILNHILSKDIKRKLALLKLINDTLSFFLL